MVADTKTPPETCAICHKDAGEKHQASYDELYQDGVIKVTDVAYAFTSAPDTTTITFKMTKNGQPFDPKQADNISIYFVPYADGKFQFDPPAERLALKGNLTWDGAGNVTSTLVEKEAGAEDFVDYTDISGVNGLIVIYGRDETVRRIPGTRVDQNRFPFAAVLETGAGVDYVSPANNDGCELCHTQPYLKHSYIYGQVDNDSATDFYTCKACHLDNGTGEHFEWQLLVEDPPLAAQFLAGEVELTEEQHQQFAYNPSVMNDVHMSHAMEFPYPQSMANCVTCHAGKLDAVLTDATFNITTCRSCHPMTGAKAEAAEGEDPAYDTTGLALKTLLTGPHANMDLATTDCSTCHGEGKMAPAWSVAHTGYDTTIYTADGIRYSDAISVTIESAMLDGDTLSVKFSAAESPDIEGVDAADIVPSVLVGLYGWNTKDFVVGAHERLFDDNGDGTIDSKDMRTLEFEVGAEHPRMKTVSAEGGQWEITADLSPWKDLIANGTVKRVEVGVLPALVVDEQELAIDATTRTFDLAANAFDDKYFKPIADIEKCQNCHAALATNFHSPDYGGSVTACRMCHVTKSGGSHLEMQSRSLDSYAHAIHSGQAFDISDIDFGDPVQAMHYEHHIAFPYPTHANTNCESCHFPGTYEVPDQGKSLPGLLSASDDNETLDRDIESVPSYVTGPATRACGGCHRAELIKEDSAGGFAMLKEHMDMGGYFVEAGEAPLETLQSVFDEVMPLFK